MKDLIKLKENKKQEALQFLQDIAKADYYGNLLTALRLARETAELGITADELGLDSGGWLEIEVKIEKAKIIEHGRRCAAELKSDLLTSPERPLSDADKMKIMQLSHLIQLKYIRLAEEPQPDCELNITDYQSLLSRLPR